MANYVERVIEQCKANNPGEVEFHQTVEEVLTSLAPVMDAHPEYEKAAHASFDCVSCNICASRCPAQISHSAVGLLCRRLTGKYIQPKCEHLADRVAEIENGDYVKLLEKLKNTPLDELKDMYNKREIEK